MEAQLSRDPARDGQRIKEATWRTDAWHEAKSKKRNFEAQWNAKLPQPLHGNGHHERRQLVLESPAGTDEARCSALAGQPALLPVAAAALRPKESLRPT